MQQKIQQIFLFLSLLVWVGLGLVVGVTWMGPHIFAMQVSQASSYQQLIKPSNKDWSISHVLSADCECSEQVLKSLLLRKPLLSNEQVLFLGKIEDSDQVKLQNKGYQVRVVHAQELGLPEAFALPSLLIQNPSNQLVYAGGYSNQKIFTPSQVQDTQIFAALSQGKAVAALPIYGCYTQAKWGHWVNSFKVSFKK